MRRALLSLDYTRGECITANQTLLELIIIQYQIRISSITLVNVYVYIPTHRLNATIICIAVIEWTRGTNSYIKPVAILSLQATYYISQRHGLICHIILQRQPSTFPIVLVQQQQTTGKKSLYSQ